MSGLRQKYNDIPVPARASLWYTICSVFQKGIAFIVIPIYTRVLTTGEYGQYSVFQSWLGIIIIFATLNLYCGVFTKAMVDYPEDRDRYISCMQGLSTVITTIVFGIYCVAQAFWNRVFEMETTTMVIMFVYFIFYPAFSFWTVRQRVELKYQKMVFVTVIVSIATPVISLLLLFCTPLRANAVIWGYMFVQILVGAFFYFYHFYKCKAFFIKAYWLHGLRFNIPLIPHYLSLIVLGQSDRIMISEFCGSDKAGIYNLAYQVSMMMNVVIGAINNSLVPWIYEKLKVRKFDELKSVSNKLCILVGVMSLGIIMIAPEVIRILGTQEYYQAIWVIPAVALSVYYSFCYGLFSAVEFYFGSTQLVMIASTVGAVINIILNWIFIPIYGFIAAGYTTLFCYLLFMLMHYLFMLVICKKKITSTAVFDSRFIFASCLVITSLAAGCLILYNYSFVRYLTLIMVAIVLLIKRKTIMTIIRSIRS